MFNQSHISIYPSPYNREDGNYKNRSMEYYVKRQANVKWGFLSEDGIIK